MDTPTSLRFYPGTGSASPEVLPLARYLPPLPPGMASAWLAENIPAGSWLLDPLGASPALTLEAARAGCRVLVASNNPILTFLLETLAGASSSADFQSALAELAMSRRGEERLEVHLRSLYQTACDICGQRVEAQAFLWRKGETQPYARQYACPKCGETGEHPVIQPDLDRLAAMGSDRMQRSRALQRVLLNDEEHRADVEEALEHYLPRPLYVLFTLANKIEGLGLPPARTRLLQALMISLFDAGSTLWPWPGGRARPKQLLVPPQFREVNLWTALEKAGAEWSHQPGPVPVTRWPNLPPQAGGICIYRGRVKALMPLPTGIEPKAVVSVFPRPNQAFWTLSVLWTGWLWGAEAALPLRNVLDRRRYDWNWHTSAIHSALAPVASSLPAETPFFGLLPELAPGFLSAVIAAAEAAGFRLEGLAMRADSDGRGDMDLAQAVWRPVSAPESERAAGKTAPLAETHKAGQMEAAARAAIRADLLARSEPASYLVEYAAGLAALAQGGCIPPSLSSIPGDLLTRVQAALARTFSDRSLLKLYGGPGEEERGLWSLVGPDEDRASPDQVQMPLADRVEIEVVRFMQKNAVFHFEELDHWLCSRLTGLLTPPVDLVRACLESYGESIPAKPGTYRMRTSEMAVARKSDLQDMRTALETLGRRLGYTPRSEGYLVTWEENGQGAWWFYCMASSIISRYVLKGGAENATAAAGEIAAISRHSVIVLPGSRARLLTLKLKRDPRLAEAAQGWRYLKYRHLRDIAARESVSQETWDTLLSEDPLIDEALQMELFPHR